MWLMPRHEPCGRIFTEPLEPAGSIALDDDTFRAFCCVLLSLPPPVAHGPLLEIDGFDYPVQLCLNEHAGCPFVDTNASHAASGCPPARPARQRKHGLARVLAKFAREAALEARLEQTP